MRSGWRRRSRLGERGSITPFVVIVSLGILLLAALVVDGGRQLNAKGRAIAYAQEAARAGSQAVDVTDPELDLVPARALAAARAYCDRARSVDDQLGRCEPRITTVNDEAGDFLAVQVSTHVQADAILLGMIGQHVLDATGDALARPVSGISEADSGKVSTVGPPDVGEPSEGPEPPTAPPGPPDISVSPCATESPTPTDEPSGPGNGGDGGNGGDNGGGGGGGDNGDDEDGGDSAPSPSHDPCETPSS